MAIDPIVSEKTAGKDSKQNIVQDEREELFQTSSMPQHEKKARKGIRLSEFHVRGCPAL